MQKEKVKIKNAGFSLLETVVAISILMITIVGPLELASKGILYANYVKDEITGFYLAQEAMEAIRNIRDTNIKNYGDDNWLKTIDSCLSSADNPKVHCRIDIWDFNQPDYGLRKCGVGDVPSDETACETLKEADVPEGSATERLYGYDFGGGSGNIVPQGETPEDSIFSRKITIKKVDYSGIKIPPQDQSLIDEINVKVDVSWLMGTIPRTVTVSENLFSF